MNQALPSSALSVWSHRLAQERQQFDVIQTGAKLPGLSRRRSGVNFGKTTRWLHPARHAGVTGMART
jgi:hypothetical protein